MSKKHKYSWQCTQCHRKRYEDRKLCEYHTYKFREYSKKWHNNNKDKKNKKAKTMRRRGVWKYHAEDYKTYSKIYNIERSLGEGAYNHYQKQLEEQSNKCAICFSDVPGSKHGWQRDHRHPVNTDWRGVLCVRCNTSIKYIFCRFCKDFHDTWILKDKITEAYQYIDYWNNRLGYTPYKCST